MRTAFTIFTTALAAILTLTIAACDAPPADRDTADGQQLREAPLVVLYLSQYDATVTTVDFADIVNACPSKRPLALTFTRYPKHVTGADEQVIGLGFSVTADGAWADCYEGLMVKLGAQP